MPDISNKINKSLTSSDSPVESETGAQPCMDP